MEMGLHLQQTQKLIVTPELRQAIEILQMSSIDLIEFTNKAMLENPLLESAEPEAATEAAVEERRRIDWELYANKSQEYRDQRGLPREIQKEVVHETMAANQISLEDHLLNQWRFMALEPMISQIGRYIIGNLSSSGYLEMPLTQVAADLKVKEKDVLRALKLLQTLDPAGVCARDLRECLLLQLDRQEVAVEEKKLLTQLIKNYLEDIGKGSFVRIAKELNISPVVVQSLVDEIKKLNPKPGVSFSSGEDVTYIVPDVLVERDGNDFRIVLTDNYLPQISINEAYAKILKEQSQTDKEATNFVENKLNQAAWLIRCFEQRRSTILKVTEALIRRQRGFFEYGVAAMHPLTMREIAEDVGVHESTISRTAANKYIQTPHGVFEFKFLFSPGLESKNGVNISTESIREMIREVIQEEQPAKPYSDHQIAVLLGQKGVQIARRTVAKYREEMGIPSTALRRRY